MTKFMIGAAMMLATAALTSGCAKHDETVNVTTTNETVVDETSGASADNLSAVDTTGNAEAGANASAPAGNSL